MASFIEAVKNGVSMLQRGDDDGYDRLSSRYSVAICLVFSILVSGGVYIGDPIDCWTPAEFTGQWVKYTDQYCWIKNTYYVPQGENIPKKTERQDKEITYYQWTPIILAFQALLFSLPMLIWKALSKEGGYDVHQIVTTCNKSDLINPEKRDDVIRYLTLHLDRLLGYRREYRDGLVARFRKHYEEKCCMCGKRYGNYLFILYLLTKCFHIVVALFQLFALNWVIGSGYHLYGLKVVNDLVNRKGWEASPFFPRITLCDFQIRKLGDNLQGNTVQCVLPYNLFNEKIYIFMWWWLVFVSAMSILGLLIWLFTITSRSNIRFVNKYLRVMSRLHGEDAERERKMIDEFANRYLRRDGMFVLRMVAKHVSDLTAAELVCSLWDNFVANVSKSADGKLEAPPSLMPSKHDI